MIYKSLFSLLLIVGLIFTFHEANASHLRAGEIIVKRVNCQGLTFEITIIVYTDNGRPNPVLFGKGELRFGDESSANDYYELPEIQNNTQLIIGPNGETTIEPFNEDLGEDVAKAAFTIRHTYGSGGKKIISYREANRNGGILNIENGNSINTTFYIETEIRIDGFLGCNNTPELLIPPIDRACPGVAFYHNPGAFDPDGDSIAFELVVPKKDVGTEVANYISPSNRAFYENYNSGNENGNGIPEFSINPVTGEIKWDAPGTIGEFNVAFIVKEYRFKGGEWFFLGFVTRDMQIIVEDCDNERPELIIPEDICVQAGESINEVIFGTDPDNDQVKIEAFSQTIESLGATVSPDPAVYQPSSPPAELSFNWDTDCLDIRDQPYSVVFKITDFPPNGPKLVSFATWNITVVGPEPDFLSVQQDGQAIKLDWSNYSCQNAETIQIWRRVDSNPYLPDECETGIRNNAGYSLLNEVAPNVTSYRDTQIAAAAKYCYRLVAVFPSPPGGESIVSQELCFEFVPAEEPIITHVTVDETSTSDGQITVAWRAPFDFGNFPSDTLYNVYRAAGIVGTGFELIATVDGNGLDSIGFVDTGLDTENIGYNYRVALVDPSASTGTDLIFSASASSVRLQLVPQFGQIQLNWFANVPWSNNIPAPPGSQHLIYRGIEGQAQNQFTLLAALDVNQYGFSYIDSVNLDDSQVYCYRVLTKGTYGNPAINSPMLNYSQISCAQPNDSIAPCAPKIVVEGRDCSEFLTATSCDFNTFENQISWTTEFIEPCDNDVSAYQVYYASTVGSEYNLIAEVTDTTYLHQNLTSFKGCYRVRAVDRSGNVGEFSDPFCLDNCPYYELPNIFTPNNDNCNELFSAYSNRQTIGEGGVSTNCGDIDFSKCARFVKRVDFTVFNRWGGEVYKYTGIVGTESSIYIDWDGNNSNGVPLSSGVYYYSAEVTFDVVNPENEKVLYKGWIQLAR